MEKYVSVGIYTGRHYNWSARMTNVNLFIESTLMETLRLEKQNDNEQIVSRSFDVAQSRCQKVSVNLHWNKQKVLKFGFYHRS